MCSNSPDTDVLLYGSARYVTARCLSERALRSKPYLKFAHAIAPRLSTDGLCCIVRVLRNFLSLSRLVFVNDAKSLATAVLFYLCRTVLKFHDRERFGG